jgi:nitrogen fixation NifU-like protein
MNDVDELYQEVILDHNSRPRNFRELEDANRKGDGFNPLCGDQVSVYLKVEEGRIADIGFQARGCAISKSSASMMTESIKGKTVEQAEAIFAAFRRMIAAGSDDGHDADLLGDLEILAGVARYPARIKCATLSWHTLRSALNGSAPDRVSTE